MDRERFPFFYSVLHIIRLPFVCCKTIFLQVRRFHCILKNRTHKTINSSEKIKPKNNGNLIWFHINLNEKFIKNFLSYFFIKNIIKFSRIYIIYTVHPSTLYKIIFMFSIIQHYFTTRPVELPARGKLARTERNWKTLRRVIIVRFRACKNPIQPPRLFQYSQALALFKSAHRRTHSTYMGRVGWILLSSVSPQAVYGRLFPC